MGGEECQFGYVEQINDGYGEQDNGYCAETWWLIVYKIGFFAGVAYYAGVIYITSAIVTFPECATMSYDYLILSYHYFKLLNSSRLYLIMPTHQNCSTRVQGFYSGSRKGRKFRKVL